MIADGGTPFKRSDNPITELSVTCRYADGTERTVTIPDPRFVEPTASGPELAYDMPSVNLLVYVQTLNTAGVTITETLRPEST